MVVFFLSKVEMFLGIMIHRCTPDIRLYCRASDNYYMQICLVTFVAE